MSPTIEALPAVGRISELLSTTDIALTSRNFRLVPVADKLAWMAMLARWHRRWRT